MSKQEQILQLLNSLNNQVKALIQSQTTINQELLTEFQNSLNELK